MRKGTRNEAEVRRTWDEVPPCGDYNGQRAASGLCRGSRAASDGGVCSCLCMAAPEILGSAVKEEQTISLKRRRFVVQGLLLPCGFLTAEYVGL